VVETVGETVDAAIEGVKDVAESVKDAILGDDDDK